MSPEKIVGFLNEIFSSLDKIQEAYPRIEKIKTIGDGNHRYFEFQLIWRCQAYNMAAIRLWQLKKWLNLLWR